MARRYIPSAKNEPAIKEECSWEDILQHFYPSQASKYPAQVVDPYSSTRVSAEMAYQSSSASYSSTSTHSSFDCYDLGPTQAPQYVQPLDLTLSPAQESDPEKQYINNHQYEYDMQPPTALNQDSISKTRTNPNGKGDLWQCLMCTSHFTRSADLTRHYATCHNPNAQRFDCPKHRCGRVGENGFTRKDHLAEHLRSYHKDPNVPKRNRK